MWPETKKLKQKQKDGKFDFSPETQAYIDTLKAAKSDVLLEGVLAKLKRREVEKEQVKDEKEQPWYLKGLTSEPDI